MGLKFQERITFLQFGMEIETFNAENPELLQENNHIELFMRMQIFELMLNNNYYYFNTGSSFHFDNGRVRWKMRNRKSSVNKNAAKSPQHL